MNDEDRYHRIVWGLAARVGIAFALLSIAAFLRCIESERG